MSKKVCKTVSEKKCSTSYKQQCKTVQEKVCNGYNAYKQPQCHYVPRQHCDQVIITIIIIIIIIMIRSQWRSVMRSPARSVTRFPSRYGYPSLSWSHCHCHGHYYHYFIHHQVCHPSVENKCSAAPSKRCLDIPVIHQRKECQSVPR